MSIKDNLLKIKPHINKNLIWALILIFVAISSFGLGRLSSERNQRTPIILGSFKIENPQVIDAKISNILVAPASIKVEEIIVASKNGKSYYLTSCASAKKISAENKITFASRELAEKAGYKPAQTCKGLNETK